MSDTDDQPFQVMPEFDPDEFERLKKGIKEHGIEYPIIVDGDDHIIDGHHRYQAWVDLGRDPDEIPRRVVDDTDTENYHRAYRTNLNQRDLTDGTKREVVKQYLLEHSDRVGEDTQQAIAEDLGVSEDTVRRAKEDAVDEGLLNLSGENLNTDEKREQVREYVEANPTASNREVARKVDCDVSHVTVGKWRDEWDIEEPTTGLDTLNTFGAEADKAQDVVEAYNDDEENDDEVREFAKQKAQEINRGESTPDEAKNQVDIATRTTEIDCLTKREDPSTVDCRDEPLQVLNLYAGIGGNRRLWGDDVDVTAVELDSDIADIYRDNFPEDTVIEADAHEWLLEHLGEFHFIWSSPPCPTHSQMEAINHARWTPRYPDMELYQEVILLKNRAEYHNFHYCVENVVSYYDPLIEPQKQDRHYYWSDVNVPAVETPTLRKRGSENRDSAPDVGSAFDYERHEKVLGFDLSPYDVPRSKKKKMLKNCVQPEQGKAILESVIDSADPSAEVVS
jgi:DNA (cytosine-5)-methyltransferase 1